MKEVAAGSSRDIISIKWSSGSRVLRRGEVEFRDIGESSGSLCGHQLLVGAMEGDKGKGRMRSQLISSVPWLPRHRAYIKVAGEGSVSQQR